MCKRMVVVLLAAMMSFAAGSAFAMKDGDHGMMDCKCMGGGEKGMMMDGKGMAGRFMMMAEMLELNAEQQKALEVIHFAHHKEVVRKTADIDVAVIELQEIRGKEPVKVEDAEKKIRAIAALRADLEIMHLKTKESVKAKLNPEQLEKMKKHMAAGMDGKMEEMDGCKMEDCMNDCCKMGGKAKKCDMMKDHSGGGKAPHAEAAGKDAKADDKKSDHSKHH